MVHPIHIHFALAPSARPAPHQVTEPLPIPKAQTAGAAGMDLVAWVPEPVVLRPFQRARIPTGVCVAIPQGYEGQVRPRSGLAARHGVTVLNAPGTVDADYRGEVVVLLINLGEAPFEVHRGDRIAQLVVSAVAHPLEVKVTDALPSTDRGSGGFGSTGLTAGA
jgi:dUTP pyrophosphatase